MTLFLSSSSSISNPMTIDSPRTQSPRLGMSETFRGARILDRGTENADAKCHQQNSISVAVMVSSGLSD
jgi:hypothetical protein